MTSVGTQSVTWKTCAYLAPTIDGGRSAECTNAGTR